MRGLSLSIAALVLATADPALAAWTEARAPHFIVYSEGSPASVRQFTENLERFDRSLRKLMSFGDGDEVRANPLTVYVVGSVSAVGDLCQGGTIDDKKACRSIAGFYDGRASGSVAFVPRRSGRGSDYDLDPQTILFHEYAHHLMLGSSAAAYPAWYVEGFAEFVSNSKIDSKGSIGIGMPAKSRAWALFEGSRIPMRELLTASPWTLTESKRGVFYGRAWLLTHYFTLGGERPGEVGRYLALLNSGKSSIDAATGAFGDLGKLDKDLDAYLNRKMMRYLPLPAESIAEDAIRLRQLSAGEGAMMPVRLQSDRGVDRSSAPAVAADARRIAASYPADPAVLDVLAEATFDADDLDGAETAVDRALTAFPDDRHAMLYKAQIIARRAVVTGRSDKAAWAEVRSWLRKANKIDPNAAWPLMLFYQSFLAQQIKPSINAVQALRRSLELVPQDGGLRMLLVSEYLMEDDLTEARSTLAPLAFDPHSPPDSPAVRLLALIDQRDKAGIARFMTRGGLAEDSK